MRKNKISKQLLPRETKSLRFAFANRSDLVSLRKIIIIIIILFSIPSLLGAQTSLNQKLAGKILLQTESNGEAWYVNPDNNKKYYLGKPTDAFNLMRNLSIGISNENLEKFSIGLIDYDDEDADNDGLSNRLENALGTAINNKDTDADGYPDKQEIENGYNPLKNDELNIDSEFALGHAGKIFLQTEQNGEAWYINPNDNKRYYLGRPADAFLIMKNFGLGITNNNLNKINTGYFSNYIPKTSPATITPPICVDCGKTDAQKIISAAATAIRANHKEDLNSVLIPEMQTLGEYTLNFLDSEGRLLLGNILSGSKQTSATDNEKLFTNKIDFMGDEITVKFYIKKQTDDSWLLANL
ncbi:hypothetical protein DRH27_04045 [Candidatus Falkowbacteria bacterium]|nr:MAG: hypothetical protein DRH27_04045 [Candidatus Falkowbacteria bacterium]